MSVVGGILGLVFLVGSIAALTIMPRPGGVFAALVRLGRGTRRWWVLGLAVAAPTLVGVGASLSASESRPFALVLVSPHGGANSAGCAFGRGPEPGAFHDPFRPLVTRAGGGREERRPGSANDWSPSCSEPDCRSGLPGWPGECHCRAQLPSWAYLPGSPCEPQDRGAGRRCPRCFATAAAELTERALQWHRSAAFLARSRWGWRSWLAIIA